MVKKIDNNEKVKKPRINKTVKPKKVKAHTVIGDTVEVEIPVTFEETCSTVEPEKPGVSHLFYLKPKLQCSISTEDEEPKRKVSEDKEKPKKKRLPKWLKTLLIIAISSTIGFLTGGYYTYTETVLRLHDSGKSQFAAFSESNSTVGLATEVPLIPESGIRLGLVTLETVVSLPGTAGISLDQTSVKLFKSGNSILVKVSSKDNTRMYEMPYTEQASADQIKRRK